METNTACVGYKQLFTLPELMYTELDDQMRRHQGWDHSEKLKYKSFRRHVDECP